MQSAYFVKYPRTIEEVRRPHDPRTETPYEIVKTIALTAIEYENFITDLFADRWFLEDNAQLCGSGIPMRCLFIHRRRCLDGLLVIPNWPHDPAHLKFAAYISISASLSS